MWCWIGCRKCGGLGAGAKSFFVLFGGVLIKNTKAHWSGQGGRLGSRREGIVRISIIDGIVLDSFFWKYRSFISSASSFGVEYGDRISGY